MRPKADQMYIGTACDHAFAQHTAVTLTSLDLNGAVPEATILIAAFDLTDDDRKMIRAGAGRPDAQLRFVDIDRDMLRGLAHDRFTTEYPLPVLGRLFLPERIDVAGSRLITIDSDMIVNTSLRPLFDLDLGNDYIAAIHDVPRTHDATYFNSGLMVIDVDTYRHWDIATRSLQWLAMQDGQPQYPDQDALNHAVGRNWVRLDRSWNYYYIGGEPAAQPETFERARIAHFAGAKPWAEESHAGRALYMRHLDELNRRIAERARPKSWWKW